MCILLSAHPIHRLARGSQVKFMISLYRFQHSEIFSSTILKTRVQVGSTSHSLQVVPLRHQDLDTASRRWVQSSTSCSVPTLKVGKWYESVRSQCIILLKLGMNIQEELWFEFTNRFSLAMRHWFPTSENLEIDAFQTETRLNYNTTCICVKLRQLCMFSVLSNFVCLSVCLFWLLSK